jgi:hypothetical protein
MEPCQLGGLAKGTRFVKEDEAQLNQFAQGAIYVVMGFEITPGGNLVIVAPDYRPGSPPHPDAFRKLDYTLRVRPLKS